MPREGIYVAKSRKHPQTHKVSARALRSNGSDVFHVHFSCLSKTREQRSEPPMIHQEIFTYSTFGRSPWGNQPSSTRGQIQQRSETDRMMKWGPDPAWPWTFICAWSPGTFSAYKQKLTGGRARWSAIYYLEADKKNDFPKHDYCQINHDTTC